MGKADLKARLYADYGDVKVDLVVMEPISEEQKIAAKQNKKKKGKKATTRESEEQEDSVGGFKF